MGRITDSQLAKISLSSKALQNFIFVLIIAGIVPFIVNSLFANPWTDDFCYSVVSRSHGFLDSQLFWYKEWTGRYFSTALLSVNPLVYGQLWGYKLIPIVLIFSLFTAILFFTSELTGKSISIQKKFLFSLMLLLVYLDQMPDIRPGLYWMAGSLTYQITSILTLLLFAVMLRQRSIHEPKTRTTFRTFAILLAIAVPGTNEVALAMLFPMLLYYLWIEYKRFKRVDPFSVIVLIALGVGASFALLAPGNSVRMEVYLNNQNLLFALVSAMSSTLESIMVWIGTSPVIILSLFVTAVTMRTPNMQKHLPDIHPLNASIVLVLFVFGCFFPPIYSTGHYPDRRVLNLIYFLFLIGCQLNVAMITSRYHSKISTLVDRFRSKIIIPSVSAYLILLFYLGHSNFLLVTNDLVSGTSYQYNQELQKRYAYINDDPSDQIFVKNLGHKPKSLFFADINHTNENWANQSYANYFGKKAITLEKELR